MSFIKKIYSTYTLGFIVGSMLYYVLFSILFRSQINSSLIKIDWGSAEAKAILSITFMVCFIASLRNGQLGFSKGRLFSVSFFIGLVLITILKSIF